jgi:hypothetical protein
MEQQMIPMTTTYANRSTSGAGVCTGGFAGRGLDLGYQFTEVAPHRRRLDGRQVLRTG